MKTKTFSQIVSVFILVIVLISPQMTTRAAPPQLTIWAAPPQLTTWAAPQLRANLFAPVVYDRVAAVKWARENYNNSSQYGGVCVSFVTLALNKGGINIPRYDDMTSLVNWLRAHPDTWEVRDPDKLEAGDFLMLGNPKSVSGDVFDKGNLQHVVFATTNNPLTFSGWTTNQTDEPVSYYNQAYHIGIHIKTDSTITPTPFPTSAPTSGGMDLTGYCRSQGYVAAIKTTNNAYGWKCKAANGAVYGMDLVNACYWQYHGVFPIPRYSNFNDPNSWRCWAK